MESTLQDLTSPRAFSFSREKPSLRASSLVLSATPSRAGLGGHALGACRDAPAVAGCRRQTQRAYRLLEGVRREHHRQALGSLELRAETRARADRGA